MSCCGIFLARTNSKALLYTSASDKYYSTVTYLIDINIYADWIYHLFLEIDDISELSVWTKLRLTSQMIKKYLDLIMNQIIYSSNRDKIFLMKIWIQVLFEFYIKTNYSSSSDKFRSSCVTLFRRICVWRESKLCM